MRDDVTIFVYGSLRAGGTLAGWIDPARPRRPALIDGRLYRVAGSGFSDPTGGRVEHGGYPTVDLTEAAEYATRGEVVTVSWQQFSALHRMEAGAGYFAEAVSAYTEDGHTVQAVVWWQPHGPNDLPIPGGDWIAHTTERTGA